LSPFHRLGAAAPANNVRGPGGSVAPLELAPDRVLPRLTLARDERSAILALAAGLPDDSYGDSERYCALASEAVPRLPARIARAVRAFKCGGGEGGVLAVDPCLESAGDADEPVAEERPTVLAPLVVGVQALLNQAIGETVGFEAVAGGRLFHPLSYAEHVGEPAIETVRGASHVRPDVVSVAWLRRTRASGVHVLSARALSAALDPAERAVVRSPSWSSGIDVTSRGGSTYVRGSLEPYALLGGAEQDPSVHLDPARLGRALERAHGLERRLERVIVRHAVHYAPAPGEIVLVDNRRAILGVSTADADFESPAIRSFVVLDLFASRHARPGDGRVVVARAERAVHG
jgi:L-asparagine oxygenase